MDRPDWHDQVTEVTKEEALALRAMGIQVFVAAKNGVDELTGKVEPWSKDWDVEPYSTSDNIAAYIGFDAESMEPSMSEIIWGDHFLYIAKEDAAGRL